MLDDSIPAKTAAGRLEVEQRALRLNPRQRAVLIAINGERKLGDVRRQFEAFGDVDALFDELAEAGLIEFTGTAPVIEVRKEPLAEREAVTGPPPEIEESTPALAARKFMNNTAVKHLGLRAFMFTRKVEKCYTQRELYDLLPEFRRHLRKVMTNADVNACHEHAEALIAQS